MTLESALQALADLLVRNGLLTCLHPIGYPYPLCLESRSQNTISGAPDGR